MTLDEYENSGILLQSETLEAAFKAYRAMVASIENTRHYVSDLVKSGELSDEGNKLAGLFVEDLVLVTGTLKKHL